MNKGLLNQAFLEKDIEKIKYYTNEEKKILIKIYKKMEDCTKNYNSVNKNLFLNNINNYMKNIEKISNKRNKYIDVFIKVIEKYKLSRNQTIDIFEKY